MDFANYNDIVKLAKDQSEIDKVKLILDYPNSNLSEVPDPYFGGNEGFKKVFKLIDDACDYHSKKLQSI